MAVFKSCTAVNNVNMTRQLEKRKLMSRYEEINRREVNENWKAKGTEGDHRYYLYKNCKKL